MFVDDPSNCRAYLWCNYNSSRALISVHQGLGDENVSFDGTANGGAGACDANLACGDLCAFNPVEVNIRVIIKI